MSDPRELLDSYAAEVHDGRDGARYDEIAPAVFAALRAALDEHSPLPLRAGVLPERWGDGRCVYCHLGPPIREYRGKYVDHLPEVDMHEHVDPEPVCAACVEVEDHEITHSPWPCSTVEAITTALESS